VINGVNDDFNLRTSSFVEDLIMIQNEILESNRAVQIIEKKAEDNFENI